MIISVHVPKCAGTSFGRILETQHGDRLWKNYGAIFTREEARKDLIPDGTQCIHGHFFADAFSDLFPAGQLITWVRHPVERVVSNYQVTRIMQDGSTLLFSCGRYLDRIRFTKAGPLFAERVVVYDNRRVDTLLAIPL